MSLNNGVLKQSVKIILTQHSDQNGPSTDELLVY